MKKLLAALLTLAMVLSAAPMGAVFAGEQAAELTAAQSSADPFDNSYNLIVNKATGRAITVKYNGTSNHDLIITETPDADPSKANASMIWRITPIGGDLYYAANKKSGRSMDVPDAKKDEGVQLIQYSYNGNAQQKMAFEETDTGFYTIKPSHAEMYLADLDGAVVQTADNKADTSKWALVTVAPSMMGSVSGSEGYALLGEDQKRAFDNYFFNNLDSCKTVRGSAENLLCSNDYFNKTPAEQKRLLTTALTYTAFGQVTGNVVNETPAKYEIVSAERVEDFDIWRGTKMPCWVYQVEMEGDVEGQVHKFQFVSNDEDKDSPMVAKAIEALGVFPYAIRQHLHNLYWRRGDTANSYNGGGNSIWIRLNWEPSRQQISQTLSHELGHVLEQNMLNDPDVWSLAERLDACPISSYGSSNETEDLAEFSRTYWTNLGKDTFGELEKVYPNRLKVFQGLLYRADNEYFKDYADDEKYIEELSQRVRDAGSDSDCSKLSEGKLYKIVDPLTDKALTVTDNSMGNDVPLTMSQFTYKPGQIFYIEKYGDLIKLYSANSNKPIQLDDSAMSGKSIAQYGGTWAIDEKFAVYEKDGLFELMATRYQLYISPFGDAAAQTVEPKGWKIVEVGENDAKLGYLTVDGKSLIAGEAAQPVTAGDRGTVWRLGKAEDTGYYKLIDTESGLSLDILDSSKEEGASVITYDFYASDNQLFDLEYSGESFRIKNVNSGLYLTLNGDGSVTQEKKGDGQLFEMK